MSSTHRDAGTLVERDAQQISVVHTVSSLSIGGMEQVVLRLASAQKAAGYRVGVLALRGGPLEDYLREHGVSVEVLGSGRIHRCLRTLRFFLRERPNIVHAHNSTSLHYAAIGKVVSRAPLVVTVHGETHWRLGSALEWRLATSVIAVSRAAMHTFQFPCAADKFTVIHNGIAPVAEGFSCERTRSSLDVDGKFVGAMVARIDGRKGHATLLKSIRILRDENVGVLLLVVGDGALRSDVERQAKTLSLESDTVRFLGSRSDVGRILSVADFFVLPSDTEGLPLSVLEAMAHGLPVIASRVGGIPELIGDEDQGLLVPPQNPVALAAAIRRLAGDPGLRRKLGDAGRARATNEFSLSTTVRNYEQLYRRAQSA